MTFRVFELTALIVALLIASRLNVLSSLNEH